MPDELDDARCLGSLTVGAVTGGATAAGALGSSAAVAMPTGAVTTPGATGAEPCASTVVGIGPPIAMRPGSGSFETTVVGIGLNSGCPPATPRPDVAFQGRTSFCCVE